MLHDRQEIRTFQSDQHQFLVPQAPAPLQDGTVTDKAGGYDLLQADAMAAAHGEGVRMDDGVHDEPPPRRQTDSNDKGAEPAEAGRGASAVTAQGRRNRAGKMETMIAE